MRSWFEMSCKEGGYISMGDIYDGTFRTILNDCRHLILPVLNEVFGENYVGDEAIEFNLNEHFIVQQNEADLRRITDTNFCVHGIVTKKYHWECESRPNRRILIRLFEYDAQIALDEETVTNETLIVTFPHTAVLYLRNYKNTPDRMCYEIHTPGGEISYDIPIMKVQSYSLEEIFEKHLLMLIPFYIFSHESNFIEYNSNEQKLEVLKVEYRKILDKLNEFEQQGYIDVFDKRTIIELSENVITEITKKYENVRKGMGDVMRGELLETEARRLKNEGKSEGRLEGKIEAYIELIKDNLISLSEAAKRLRVSEDLLKSQLKQ